MMATLTLHQGERQQEFVEHPIEVARRALIKASEIEDEPWAGSCRRVAGLLPHREPLRRRED